MPDMSQLVSGWTPTPEHPYMVAEVPAGQAVNLALNIKPGPANPEKQMLLLQAVNDKWKEGVVPREWLLWELKISSNGSAVIERDGRGNRQRELEPWKIANWAGAGQPPIRATLSFDPTGGELDLLVEGRSTLAGPVHLRTAGPWKLIVGRPSWYRDLADPAGWTLDVAWSLGADAPPAVVTPPTPPAPPGVPGPNAPTNAPTQRMESMHWQAMLAMASNPQALLTSWAEIAKEAQQMIEAHEDWLRRQGGKP